MDAIIRTPVVDDQPRRIGKPISRSEPVRAEAPPAVHEVMSGAAMTKAEANDAALSDMKAQLQAQYEKALVLAKTDTEQQGYATGMKKADEAVKKTALQQREHLIRLVAALEDARQQVLADNEDTLVDIAFTAVCRIIGEAAITRTAVAGLVNDIVTRCRDRERVKIHLHPQDWALLQQPDEGGEVTVLDRRVEIEPDASIKLGGCIVENSVGTLDARLEIQLEQLRDTLLAVRQAQSGREGTY